MIGSEYVWFVWASAFLLPWAALYLAFPAHRRAMLWASVFTMPFGLSEPLFVPEYWSPPSLFDLARTTGFDIESLIFCFGIGGVGAVLYNVAFGVRLTPMSSAERRLRLHRLHRLAVAAPFLVFPPLYLLPWNPIYPAIGAMAVGAAATMMCRPDLTGKTWVGGALFILYYFGFLLGLEWLSPGYIDRVWNTAALSGVRILDVPVEEILFAAAFGVCWAGIYEHFMWRREAS
jgi:hypothetical protein